MRKTVEHLLAYSSTTAGSAQPVLQRLAFQASAAAVLLQVGPAHADAEVDSAVNNVIGAVKVRISHLGRRNLFLPMSPGSPPHHHHRQSVE